MSALDFQRIADAFSSISAIPLCAEIEPPEPSSCETLSSFSESRRDELRLRGFLEIAQGKAAVVILGGGQVSIA